MKQRIMEVLLSGDNNLTNEEINWAINNIPNGTGEVDIPFDHSKKKIYDACGITSDDAKDLAAEYNTIKKSLNDDNAEGICGSMMVERIIQRGSPKLIRGLIVRGILDTEKPDPDQMAAVIAKITGGDAMDSTMLQIIMKLLKDK